MGKANQGMAIKGIQELVFQKAHSLPSNAGCWYGEEVGVGALFITRQLWEGNLLGRMHLISL